MSDSHENTQFWLALLTYPGDAQQRTRYWNGYLAWKLPSDFRYKVRNVGNPPFNRFFPAAPLQLEEDEKSALDALANKFGGHPPFPNRSNGVPARYMDFSDHTFDDDVCFAGRILIKASFKDATFDCLSDFRNVTFVDTADFERATFRHCTRFDSVTFENSVYFKTATFMETTVFDGSVFRDAAYFAGSYFLPIPDIQRHPAGAVGFRNTVFTSDASFEETKLDVPSNFESAKFHGNANFKSCLFGKSADFQRAVFERTSDFSATRFEHIANFNDARFKATTYFCHSLFLQPPKFFETNLHEDTDFSGVDWRKAESCYAVSWWSKNIVRRTQERTISDVVDASEAMQAWDRLALIMSKVERLPERHDFYRLRMRAQRKRDGWSVLSLANWLFDVSCDYGWNMRRALIWWAGHYTIIGLLLFSQARPGYETCGAVLWDCLLISFSNAHAFFRLTSDGGYLYNSLECVIAALHNSALLIASGAIQTITGPIFLFLLLLTVRNRFRLR